jgi:hypothetical protein
VWGSWVLVLSGALLNIKTVRILVIVPVL